MTAKPPAEPDHSGRTMRTSVTIAATPKAAWEAWADPERIAHWFVDRASGTATAGGTMTWFFNRFKYALPYEMVLQDGGRMTGRVLAITDREVALEWEEIAGVIGLKAFGIGGGNRAVSVHGSSWRLDAAQAAEIERRMERALERLASALSAAPAHP